MAVIVLPREKEKLGRGALIGAALANGFGNVANSLFAIAQRNQENELKEQQLAQQLFIQQERLQASKDRREELKAYRENLLDMKKMGMMDTREYRQAQLGIQQDSLDLRKELGVQRLGLEATRVELARERAGRAAAAGSDGRPAKPTKSEKIIEDFNRVSKGLKPKYYKGATLEDLRKLHTKETTPSMWQSMGADMGAPPMPSGPALGASAGGMVGGMVGGAPPAAAAPATPADPASEAAGYLQKFK